MKMKKILFTILSTLLLCSCTSKSILDDERTFDHDVWNHFTPEKFDVDVRNVENYYNIDVTAVIDTAIYRYTSLPLTVNLYSPAGENRMFYAEVPFTENGRPRGEVADGRRTVRHRIRAFFSFNTAGNHNLEIAQATSQYDLEGIHSITVTISKAPLDYEL